MYRHPNQNKSRNGAVAVEFAAIAPILFLVIFGAFEVGNVIQLKSSLQNTARECARHMILPGATLTSCQEIANSSFAVSRVHQGTLTVTPSNPAPGTMIVVTATCSYGTNSWGTGMFFDSSKQISSSATMRKE